jgi:hypothetical protein
MRISEHFNLGRTQAGIEKAARRRLSNSNLMIVDQAAISSAVYVFFLA